MLDQAECFSGIFGTLAFACDTLIVAIGLLDPSQMSGAELSATARNDSWTTKHVSLVAVAVGKCNVVASGEFALAIPALEILFSEHARWPRSAFCNGTILDSDPLRCEVAAWIKDTSFVLFIYANVGVWHWCHLVLFAFHNGF